MGARRVVLYGWSMGVTLISAFLAHSAVAGTVSAVRYLEIPDVGHTCARDQDPVRYDAAATEFLRGYLR
jgi:pimeloyl-ACP methyl ester carboxylesterase